MSLRTATLLALAAALLWGCGGGEDDDGAAASANADGAAAERPQGRSLTGAGADRKRFVGRSGTAKTTACRLVRPAAVARVVAERGGKAERLKPRANDSLDLSFCRYPSRKEPNLAVSVGLDTATRAVRRYYNMLTEARQLPNIFDPSKRNRPQLVFGVGNDRTYGGAGAYWIPSRAELTAIRRDHIVKVHFYAPGVSADEAKRGAAELARLAFVAYARAKR